MQNRWFFPTTTVAIALLAAAVACSRAPMDDQELLVGIEAFERSIRGQPRETVQQLLRAQAKTYKGVLVRVDSAVIASPYIRKKTSQIYFGYNYDPKDHLFLSEIDPALDESVKNHRHWVSVVRTYSSRQLSFELPIDEATFARLAPGQNVSFSCRIVALIRGKSVYCRPVDFHSNVSQSPLLRPVPGSWSGSASPAAFWCESAAAMPDRVTVARFTATAGFPRRRAPHAPPPAR